MTIINDGIDLPFLFVPKTSFVADAALANTVEIEYSAVTLANPTQDPNRFTLYVPTETTVLSIGAASAAWKTDIGITGYTDNHVHFETKVNDKTIVSLGTSATTTDILGHGGEPPIETEGYAMVTAQRAWHQSVGQHYLISHEKDISLRSKGASKHAVVQADAGFVDINGGEEVTISGGGVAIGAASAITIEDVPYDGTFAGTSVSSTSAKNAKTGMDLISALYTVHDLSLKFYKMVKKGKPKKFAESEYFFADTLKWIADAAKFRVSVNKLKKVFAHVSSPLDSVKISAEKNVVGLAGGDVSLSGSEGASLGSLGATTIGAGLMATLKGTVFAGVGSILTSIKGRKKLEVSSTWGDVVFSAKKNVEFTSDGEFVGGAENDAQVNATTQVLMGAAKRAFIGAEPGWGVLFDDKGVAFGKASGVDKLKTAKIEASPAIRIDNDKIEIVGTDGAITLSNDLALIEAPNIHLNAKQKNVILNGSRAVLSP